MAVRSDISSAADRAALLEFTRGRLGRLDLLVNNAGVGPAHRLDMLEADEDGFDRLIATNLKGPHFLTQRAARWMIRQGEGGRIVFITSISAYAASVNRGDYCISKAGLSMSAALFAARLAPADIKVFEIRPGIIRTDMIAAVEAEYERRSPPACCRNAAWANRPTWPARCAPSPTGSSIIAPARCSTWTAVFTSARCKRSQHRKTEQTRGMSW